MEISHRSLRGINKVLRIVTVCLKFEGRCSSTVTAAIVHYSFVIVNLESLTRSVWVRFVLRRRGQSKDSNLEWPSEETVSTLHPGSTVSWFNRYVGSVRILRWFRSVLSILSSNRF